MSPIDSTIDFSTFDTIKGAQLMMTLTLKDYVSEIGQARAGQRLGVTQIAISKALRSGRSIFVQIQDGHIAAFETKPFPAKQKPTRVITGSKHLA